MGLFPAKRKPRDIIDIHKTEWKCTLFVVLEHKNKPLLKGILSKSQPNHIHKWVSMNTFEKEPTRIPKNYQVSTALTRRRLEPSVTHKYIEKNMCDDTKYPIRREDYEPQPGDHFFTH